ncbi:hypothetical protein J6590_058371 [Homalodisca vitripennis]|nr:hypothetical protein J6590_058371 [Homalodisca vitripennis]
MNQTDKGVHALCNTVHVDLDGDPRKICSRSIHLHLNRFFTFNDHDIRILRVQQVPDQFHSRHQAYERQYLYRLAVPRAGALWRQRPLVPSPLTEHNRCCFLQDSTFDSEAIKAACGIFVGVKDFGALCSKSREKLGRNVTTVRDIRSLELSPSAPFIPNRQLTEDYTFWQFSCIGKSFLYHQWYSIRESMLHQYLMGLYDSECVTHGTRRPSGGADNNGGYEPLTDEEVIASFLPDANESDAEEADGDIEDPVMSHGDAVTKLNELMVYFERQAETSPAELLMLKRLRDRTARKRQTTLAQPKLTEKHLHTLGLTTEEPSCTLCNQPKKTPKYIILDCEKCEIWRRTLFGTSQPGDEINIRIEQKLLDLLKDTRVRRMVSALVTYGQGRVDLADIQRLIDKPVQDSWTPVYQTLGACGLYLVDVLYHAEDLSYNEELTAEQRKVQALEEEAAQIMKQLTEFDGTVMDKINLKTRLIKIKNSLARFSC